MPRPVEALPCGSRSMISVRWPSSARQAPTLIVVVVLPTPPFWLATAMIRGSGTAGRRAGGAARRRRGRSRSVTSAAAVGKRSSQGGLSSGAGGPDGPPRTAWRARAERVKDHPPAVPCFTWNIGDQSTGNRRCFTWNIGRWNTATRAIGAGDPVARPQASSSAGGQRVRLGVRRLADDDQATRAQQRRGRGQRRRRRAEATGDDGVGRIAGRERRRRHGRAPSTRSPRPSRRDEAAQVIGAGRPAIDEDESQVGPGRAMTSPGTPPPLPRSTTVPATSAQGGDERRGVLDDLGDRAVTEHARGAATTPARRGAAWSPAPDRDRSGRGDDDAAVGVLALGPAGDAVDLAPARRGGPCGRPTASGRASGRRPLSFTCSATVAAKRSSATRRFSR